MSERAVSKMCWRWPPAGRRRPPLTIPPLSGLGAGPVEPLARADDNPGGATGVCGVCRMAPRCSGAGDRGPPRRVAQEPNALLEAVFAEHYAGFCRLATLLLDDRAAAEEVVQEAFLRTFSLLVAAPSARAGPAGTCGRRSSTCAGAGCGGGASEDDRQPGQLAAAGASVRRPRRRRHGVLEAVRALPRRQRETVVLRYYEDLPSARWPSPLGCSVGTVKSQLARARATLARRLAPGAGSDTEEGSRAG